MIQLRPNEEFLLVLRRHWLIAAGYIALAVLFALGPVAAVAAIQQFWPVLLEAAAQLIAFAASLYYLALWLAFFAAVVDYYLDVWVVTSERVIAIEQKGLFRREIAEFNILKVQDISTQINGLVPTLFDFGELQVQTAGEEEKFCFKQVPNPNQAKRQILACYEAAVARARQHHDDTMLPQSVGGL